MRVFRSSSCCLLGAALLVATEARAAVHCTATFELADSVTLGALQLNVEYPQPDVAFDGSGANVACTGSVAALPNFEDDDAGTLTMAFAAIGAGFSGPHDLASCEMTTAAGVTANELAVTVTDASDPDLSPVSAPAISTRIFCDGDTTTTTIASTTTTTLSPTTECAVAVELADAVTVGSLGIVVHYASAVGDFAGSGSAVLCTTVAQGLFGTYFDDESARTVTSALISLDGFAGPSALFRCKFLPDAVTPVAGDFSIDVTDAGDTDSNPIVPRPAVAVSDITCTDPAATTTTTTTTTVAVCGDGVVAGAEACDDGNLTAHDGCGPTCLIDTLCGDADANGSITAADAQRVLRASIGLPPVCPLGPCDTNGDGNLAAGDAQRVLRRSVGLTVQLLCQ